MSPWAKSISAAGPRLAVPARLRGRAAAGLATSWLVVQVRHRLDDSLLGNVLTILTPFTAFLLAEVIHASGVLAVVVSDSWISRGPRVIQADARQTTVAFWSLSTFCSTPPLFVLVGFELQSAIRGLTSVALARGMVAVGAVTAV